MSKTAKKKFCQLLSITTLLLAVGFLVFLYSFINFIKTPVNVPENGIVFEITPGTSAKKVASNLKLNRVIKNNIFFFLYAKFSRLDTKIQSGEYLITKGTTPSTLLFKFVDGDVVQYPLTIIEGWNIYKLIEVLQQAPKIKRTIQNLNLDTITANLGITHKNPEGLFFPDTYHYSATTSEIELLSKIYAKQQRLLQIEWDSRSPDLKLKNKYQALILASIVEKETSLKEEMPLVAGVYLNRLKKRMRLQADPTVIYGLGPKFNRPLSRRDLKFDTPYNTYLHRNLPPTPICIPSKTAIRAVMHPTPTDYIYFVANGAGGHTFSRTLEEHNKAVRKRFKSNKPS